MTRHSKNSTNSSMYTYAERKKDSKQSGYGTLNERLGGDSIKPFDCCSLSLQPCKDPMITPDGFIFDKEAILSYIVEQKKEQKRLIKAYEAYEKLEQQKKEMVANAEHDEKKRNFFNMESTPAHIFMDQKKAVKRRFEDSEHVGPSSKVAKDDEFKSVSNMAGDKAQKWNSFWVPELTTTAEPDKVAKPTGKVLNPMNGKPIKFKDLMSVIFTPIDERATTSLVHSMEERYKCPVTGDALTNANRAAYLKTSQRVVSWRCLENIVRKDMVDPITSQPIEESDIIELQRGGTGFAAANSNLTAKLVRPQLQLN